MGRYILIYKGEGAKPASDMKLIRDLPQTTVIDDSPSQMVLVEAPEAALTPFVSSRPVWDFTPERIYTVPDMRPQIRPDTKLRAKPKYRPGKRKAARAAAAVRDKATRAG